MKADLTPFQRVAEALAGDSPGSAVYSLGLQLRAEGMPQSELLDLYTVFQRLHYDDEDETRLNAILDTMDDIEGWRPGREFYPRA